MKKYLKFSKSLNDIIGIKKDFFIKNKFYLKDALKINSNYSKQPIRKYCKNCGNKNLINFIQNFNIDYKICKNCSHLNGKYQDTKKFASKLYYEKKGENYSKKYLHEYDLRVKNIYIPKVNFLKKIVKEKIKLIDIGSGAGHFLKALEIKKIFATGYEPSFQLSKLGKAKLKKNKIINVNFKDIHKILKNSTNINTLSMIGVLEHLYDPDLMLKAFKKSKIKYLYLSVPLFSLSTFLESSFKSVFPRQLSGGHTHLYTEKSLHFFSKKYNLEVIGEYWFGTDMLDLYRSLVLSSNILNKKVFLNELDHKFLRLIDQFQSILDKNKVSSEVHIVYKNKDY